MTTETMEPGRLLAGRYEVGELLGAGGFGATYRARDLGRFGTACVVKELLPARQENEIARRLFEREARTLCELSHPQIPTLHAYFEADGRFFLIQDFVDGETLAAHLRRVTRMPEPEVRDVVLQLLNVLVYLHGRTPPVIHRDIKPANIILATDGRVVLIDFGAVREAIGGDDQHTSIGTAGYTPREQAVGRTTPSSDCYALGATALHMISGTHPVDWHDRTTGRLDWRGKIPCSPDFEQFLDGMLAELAMRFPNAEAARDALLNGSTALAGEVTLISPSAAAQGSVPHRTFVASPPDLTPAHATPRSNPATPTPQPVRVVPETPKRNRAMVLVPAVLVIAAAGAWVATSGGTGTATDGDGRALGNTAVAVDSACTEPRTISYRTESQFDVRLLCPAGWSERYVSSVRASRVQSASDPTQVWAALWRPASATESVAAFAQRWKQTVQPELGQVTLLQEARSDASLTRYHVMQSTPGAPRYGSLQIERLTIAGSTYVVWSLVLGRTDVSRATAGTILSSIEYIDPNAPATAAPPP